MGLPGLNGLHRKRHGLQARRTHHIHRKRWHGHWQSEPQADLPGDIHSLAGPDDIAEDYTVNLRRIQPGQSGLAGSDCQVRRRIIRQSSCQFPLGRAPGGDNEDLAIHHLIPSVKA